MFCPAVQDGRTCDFGWRHPSQIWVKTEGLTHNLECPISPYLSDNGRLRGENRANESNLFIKSGHGISSRWHHHYEQVLLYEPNSLDRPPWCSLKVLVSPVAILFKSQLEWSALGGRPHRHNSATMSAMDMAAVYCACLSTAYSLNGT